MAGETFETCTPFRATTAATADAKKGVPNANPAAPSSATHTTVARLRPSPDRRSQTSSPAFRSPDPTSRQPVVERLLTTTFVAVTPPKVEAVSLTGCRGDCRSSPAGDSISNSAGWLKEVSPNSAASLLRKRDGRRSSVQDPPPSPWPMKRSREDNSLAET
jgi:hypothetical protein